MCQGQEPISLIICWESRLGALRYYKYCVFSTWNDDAAFVEIFFNFHLDSLYVSPGTYNILRQFVNLARHWEDLRKDESEERVLHFGDSLWSSDDPIVPPLIYMGLPGTKATKSYCGNKGKALHYGKYSLRLKEVERSRDLSNEGMMKVDEELIRGLTEIGAVNAGGVGIWLPRQEECLVLFLDV